MTVPTRTLSDSNDVPPFRLRVVQECGPCFFGCLAVLAEQPPFEDQEDLLTSADTWWATEPSAVADPTVAFLLGDPRPVVAEAHPRSQRCPDGVAIGAEGLPRRTEVDHPSSAGPQLNTGPGASWRCVAAPRTWHSGAQVTPHARETSDAVPLSRGLGQDRVATDHHGFMLVLSTDSSALGGNHRCPPFQYSS